MKKIAEVDGLALHTGLDILLFFFFFFYTISEYNGCRRIRHICTLILCGMSMYGVWDLSTQWIHRSLHSRRERNMSQATARQTAVGEGCLNVVNSLQFLIASIFLPRAWKEGKNHCFMT